jgi:hypothetical protein
MLHEDRMALPQRPSRRANEVDARSDAARVEAIERFVAGIRGIRKADARYTNPRPWKTKCRRAVVRRRGSRTKVVQAT